MRLPRQDEQKETERRASTHLLVAYKIVKREKDRWWEASGT